jgi:hypothetical protein
MGLKLNEFHLKSYDERSVLLTALRYFHDEQLEKYPEYKTAFEDLFVRVSRTECQPGGCSYCNEEEWRSSQED